MSKAEKICKNCLFYRRQGSLSHGGCSARINSVEQGTSWMNATTEDYSCDQFRKPAFSQKIKRKTSKTLYSIRS